MLAYSLLSLLFIALDIYLAGRSFKVRNACGRDTGVACVMAGVVNMFYLMSVWSVSEIEYSVFSSLYFVSIDVMLAAFYFATRIQTGTIKHRSVKYTEYVIFTWTVLDIVILLTNPIHGLAINYVSTTGTRHALANFKYDINFLYETHLLLTYIYVLLTLVMLWRKAAVVPENFRRQYIFMIIGILMVVGINCFYLYLPGDSVLRSADWSLFGYTVAAFSVYWSFFEYSSHGMVTRLKNYMFDHIDSGMVMFDYNGDGLLANESARKLLPEEAFRPDVNKAAFDEICGIRQVSDSGSTKVFVNNKVLMCDIGTMNDSKGRLIASTYTFKNMASELDVLTGFRYLDSFLRYEQKVNSADIYPAVCAVFDVNGLQRYNTLHGRDAGDKLLRRLSEELRRCMPESAHFVRGREAELIVICPSAFEDDMRELAEKLVAAFTPRTEYALAIADGTDVRVATAVKLAERSLSIKKLLNNNTAHSDRLSSLIKALQECDSDTEMHVNRTRWMGQMLGERLKLTDVELSTLSLLCLLHDIGKIGIPLDILNKPGKLTDAEWEVIKTHVHKGYQIAMSSKDTQFIADMLLHHHERWDGKGYPDGLSGENIPLLSRYIAVVDAFDAMVSNRVYRKAMSVEAAYRELERCAGSQFDPVLVREFVAMLRETGFTGQGDATEENVAAHESFSEFSGPDVEVHTVKYARYRFREDEVITETYEGFEELTGYSAEFIREHEFRQEDLIPECDRQEYVQHTVRDVMRTGRAYLVHRLLRSDGTIIKVLCYGKWTYDSAIKANMCEVVVCKAE